MKFSFRQILASAAGAVLAALIASSFGVKGTIIGVAIGSIAATTGSALISQSIERGHKAVKQVVVRVPDGSTATLLRRLGGTGAAGAGVSAASSSGDSAAPTEVVGDPGDETTQMESAAASADETKQVQISAATDAPATERLVASTMRVPAVPPVPPAPPRDGGRVAGADGQPRGRKFTWQAIAGTAAVVFVLALLFVTAVELIADKPLASIFGSTGSGPTIKNLFTGSPGTHTTTTTTTTSTPTSTTTSTTSSSTSTSTSTTSTTPSTTTTTTTSPGLFGTTTTTTPGSATTTTSKP